MEINSFAFAKVPNLQFGIGKFDNLPKIISSKGSTALLITGSNSLMSSILYQDFRTSIDNLNINLFEVTSSGEPTSTFVDEVVHRFKDKHIDVVISIGGGSAIDTGKAVSAMLIDGGSVKDFLEGVGSKEPSGRKIPFIAIPTTSGTGSEATKNAVLSEIGQNGFKNSLRHDNYVPDIAILDPRLTLTCPKHVTAACGLDALTQLLEAYVSTEASPMTDALALSGLEHFKAGFMNSYLNGEIDITARGNMSYASLLSGIILANAGLGVIHGFASPIGGFFNIPHGVVCGTLLSEATKMNINLLLKNEQQNQYVLNKYARAGIILSGKASTTLKNDCFLLIEVLEDLIEATSLPKLSHYSITKKDIERIVAKTSIKNNPIKLNIDDLELILFNRI